MSTHQIQIGQKVQHRHTGKKGVVIGTDGNWIFTAGLQIASPYNLAVWWFIDADTKVVCDYELVATDDLEFLEAGTMSMPTFFFALAQHFDELKGEIKRLNGKANYLTRV